MAVTREAHRVRNFGSPDEVRPFTEHGRAMIVDLDGQTVICSVFEPGWRWSADVKSIAGTPTCQAEHLGYCVSGRMRITLDSGETYDVDPGEVVHIPPGHDGQTLGDEPCVFVDFGTVADYAKRH